MQCGWVMCAEDDLNHIHYARSVVALEYLAHNFAHASARTDGDVQTFIRKTFRPTQFATTSIHIVFCTTRKEVHNANDNAKNKRHTCHTCRFHSVKIALIHTHTHTRRHNEAGELAINLLCFGTHILVATTQSRAEMSGIRIATDTSAARLHARRCWLVALVVHAVSSHATSLYPAVVCCAASCMANLTDILLRAVHRLCKKRCVLQLNISKHFVLCNSVST